MPTTQRFYPSKTSPRSCSASSARRARDFRDSRTRGKTTARSDGERRTVKDGAGDPISTIDTRKVGPARTSQLTIDSQLQLEAESVLERVGAKFAPKGASAIVMDPNTGDVLAMAN